MRKIFGLAIATLVLCSMSLMGQKKDNTTETIILKNKMDSVAYALGQSINGQQRLMYYLQHEGDMKDTTELSNRLMTAKNEGNTNLAKELKKELEQAIKSNEEKLNSFLKGFEGALNSTDAVQDIYHLGATIGKSISTSMQAMEKDKFDGSSFDKKVLFESLKSSITGKKSMIEDYDSYLNSATNPTPEDTKAKHAQRIEEEAKFFADNLQKEGVVELPSGVQYSIIQEGTGMRPSISDQVEVHYEGKLVDGTIFDSSYQRGEPITLGLQQVIKGWTEVLKIMPEGSKWKVYIPYDMGYGEMDMGQIPPYSNLIFDIELIKIVK